MSAESIASTFEGERKRLTGVAYRMLGRWSEAEDAVQDAYLRWQAADHRAIEVPAAWLTTVVVRLCIDRLRRAKAAREVYVGPWLPEPVLTAEGGERRDDDAESFAHDLSMGLMLVLERLGPEERAAFILREAFDSSYADIAAALGKNETAVRQLVSRARERVKAERPRFRVAPGAHEKLLTELLSAVQTQNTSALANLLTKDTTFISDAGGKRSAALRVVSGAEEIAKLVIHLTSTAGGPHEIRPIDVNGAPGVWIIDHRGFENVLQIETDGERITGVYVSRNPDKLAHVRAAMN